MYNIQRNIVYFLLIVTSTHIHSGWKEGSPARYVHSLGTIEECCQTIQQHVAKYPVEKLLVKKPRSNSFSTQQTTCPVYAAVLLRKKSLTEILVRYPQTNVQDPQSLDTALHTACMLFKNKGTHVSDAELQLKLLIIKALIILGYNPNLQNWQGNTALHCLIQEQIHHRETYKSIVKLLLRAGADPTITNNTDQIPFFEPLQ